MKIVWRAGTLYTKKAEWKLTFYCEKDEWVGMTKFYFLPTIEYFRDKNGDCDGDCWFSIGFKWLFWSLSINRSWGSLHERR